MHFLFNMTNIQAACEAKLTVCAKQPVCVLVKRSF